MTDHPNGSSRQRRRKRGKRPAVAPRDLWRVVPALGEPEPVVPSPEPAAVIRSLGDVPLHSQGAVAEHYLAEVVNRAATIASALAASAGLLADPDGDADDGSAAGD